ncbi:RDD domain-containing protein [Marine Group I thaumarchaeote SCGC AAA799-E16]|uniref:RDD domain-containing protein n=6 Tax=Marine Group I TaxID=905826 RepID=A0A087S7E4_9ARCH|nr:RDD domain-containing protein [Marine Group I thaumarchaeote SCGC AAA799-N04]KER05936.1 RDD domain-containing protein [Marine Group I thaumarchaeote SCGC AAA799-E16]KFM16039.1 RDD domain-containing protein [Marine Group I thaumarchaeote SCGC AAA799-D11]KFM17776.1 RDD domain-containing protein [Marine Group I thaumarchaeote SCGC RSA3]KFM19498.1 RDD domain-containing protein [Marine Group I thaumarchaeote SCGC AAA799-P11]KFM21648.1 RDD domain-containing protein [Marine Group I thaumarchaeote 
MSDSNTPKILLAKWSDRFIAWLIDFIIISSISTAIIFVSFGSIDYEFKENMFWAENSQYIPTSVIFFVYWTVLEYKTGQTIGKKILNLKSTNMHGKAPSLKGILISSFGKSFLLPFDVVLGWILTNQNRQRIFNKLGGTIVVKIKDVQDVSDVTYLKD